VATPRFLAILFGSFAGVALLIAAGGVYGSMLYTVSQRRREMGIRLALGASGGMVVSLILRQGLAVTAGGLAGGLALAVASSQLMTSLIWGVEPTDPVTLVGVAAVLAAAALVACAVPAWRASRTNPLDTLRAE
jgi:ABC-type antimicrobial peptide transport system permease subunit